MGRKVSNKNSDFLPLDMGLSKGDNIDGTTGQSSSVDEVGFADFDASDPLPGPSLSQTFVSGKEPVLSKNHRTGEEDVVSRATAYQRTLVECVNPKTGKVEWLPRNTVYMRTLVEWKDPKTGKMELVSRSTAYMRKLVEWEDPKTGKMEWVPKTTAYNRKPVECMNRKTWKMEWVPKTTANKRKRSTQQGGDGSRNPDSIENSSTGENFQPSTQGSSSIAAALTERGDWVTWTNKKPRVNLSFQEKVNRGEPITLGTH